MNIEQLHNQYKTSLKKENRLIRLYQILIFIVFFSSWELLSRKELIDPLIFSSPTKVWQLFIQKLGDGTLLSHSGVTLFETVLGFIIGTLLGTILASLLWWSPRLSKTLDPYLVILNA